MSTRLCEGGYKKELNDSQRGRMLGRILIVGVTERELTLHIRKREVFRDCRELSLKQIWDKSKKGKLKIKQIQGEHPEKIALIQKGEKLRMKKSKYFSVGKVLIVKQDLCGGAPNRDGRCGLGEEPDNKFKRKDSRRRNGHAQDDRLKRGPLQKSMSLE